MPKPWLLRRVDLCVAAPEGPACGRSGCGHGAIGASAAGGISLHPLDLDRTRRGEGMVVDGPKNGELYGWFYDSICEFHGILIGNRVQPIYAKKEDTQFDFNGQNHVPHH